MKGKDSSFETKTKKLVPKALFQTSGKQRSESFDSRRISRGEPLKVIINTVDLHSSEEISLSEGSEEDTQVWCWGSGKYGNLGTGDTEDQSLPVPIEDLQDISIVNTSCGAYGTAVVTEQGDLLMCGKAINGLFTDSYLSVPRKVSLVSSYQNVFDSPALEKESNPAELKEKARSKEYTRFVRVGFFEDHFVKQVSLGESVAAVVTKEGKAFFWGKFSSQLFSQPQAAKGLECVRKICCGSSFIIALDKQGALYAWGSNDSRELGLGTIGTAVFEPTRVEICETSQDSKSKKTVIDVFAGYSSVVCLQECEGLCKTFAWGSLVGQKGPTLVPGFEELHISSVCCTDSLIGGVSLYGDCFIHFSNAKSIKFLGISVKKVAPSIVQVFENSSIKQMVLSKSFVMGVSDLGQIWACGQSAPMLGLGNNDLLSNALVSPSILFSIGAKHVRMLSCGTRHLSALTSKALFFFPLQFKNLTRKFWESFF